MEGQEAKKKFSLSKDTWLYIFIGILIVMNVFQFVRHQMFIKATDVQISKIQEQVGLMKESSEVFTNAEATVVVVPKEVIKEVPVEVRVPIEVIKEVVVYKDRPKEVVNYSKEISAENLTAVIKAEIQALLDSEKLSIAVLQNPVIMEDFEQIVLIRVNEKISPNYVTDINIAPILWKMYRE